MKICDEIPINTMDALRGQEASLESSKGLYRDSKSLLTDASTHVPKSKKIVENLWKHENLRKSMKSDKYDGNLQRTRSQPGIEQKFL